MGSQKSNIIDRTIPTQPNNEGPINELAPQVGLQLAHMNKYVQHST